MSDVADLVGRSVLAMREYQDTLKRDPESAQVLVGELAHALIPTHVLARDLPRELDDAVGGTVGRLVMSRLGRLIGRAQAEAFFVERGLDPAEAEFRVITGPMYFAWAGYGDVDLLVYEPVMDERFTVLWESDNSASAREALRDGDRGRSCHLQAGYAAGWCEAATGLHLETREIACRAEGVSHCRFLIAHADGFDQRILEPRWHKKTSSYEVQSVKASCVADATQAQPLAP
jgi:hypothetical protein